MSLLARPVRTFLDELASAEATPGGGSAAALAGAQAAALVAMVARLSRHQAPEVADRVLGQAEDLGAAFASLTDLDARAFSQVMSAYRLPRGTEEERGRRREAIRFALIAASEVPLNICARAVDLLRVAADLAEHVNPRVVSDLGVAVLLVDAALGGAGFNVMINARGTEDASVAAGLRDRWRHLEAEAGRPREKALAIVTRALGEPA